jgi:hypothetical protein
MVPVSKTGAVIGDFAGLVSNSGRLATGNDVQNAATQINLACVSPNKITTRPGIRPVTFDEDEE